MNAVEFTADLAASKLLVIPERIAKQLPKEGKVRVILIVDDHNSEAAWHAAGYQQFLRDDSPEDAIYESLR